MRAVVIGDLHLEGFTNFFPDDSNLYKALGVPLAYAKDNSIKHIIITGDVFDNPYPSHASISAFIAWLKDNNRFTFYIIRGNHDTGKDSNVFTLLKTYQWFSEMSHVNFVEHKRKALLEGHKVDFLSWPLTSPLRDGSVVIAHNALKGVRGDNGFMLKKAPAALPTHQYIMGHIHT